MTFKPETDLAVIAASFAPRSLPTPTRRRCDGCARHAENPRHTLSFWATDGDGENGGWFHVDLSGSVYACTMPPLCRDCGSQCEPNCAINEYGRLCDDCSGRAGDARMFATYSAVSAFIAVVCGCAP